MQTSKVRRPKLLQQNDPRDGGDRRRDGFATSRRRLWRWGGGVEIRNLLSSQTASARQRTRDGEYARPQQDWFLQPSEYLRIPVPVWLGADASAASYAGSNSYESLAMTPSDIFPVPYKADPALGPNASRDLPYPHKPPPLEISLTSRPSQATPPQTGNANATANGWNIEESKLSQSMPRPQPVPVPLMFSRKSTVEDENGDHE
ncbi:hypothetical protein BDZ91DRAFT_830358 [Kalaharituber pfeilii]|nr:hypothetical protein BDZ91DRAFT_830358 [Kalaharituber pfeilii]